MPAWDCATVACSRATQWSWCLWLLVKRPSNSRQGNPGCGATISACARASRWPLALILLQQARRQRQPVAQSSMNAAINACVKSASWSVALGILQEVPRTNLAGYNATIAVCSEGSQWQQALRLLHLMPRARRWPDAFSYSSLLSACHRSSRWELAESIFRSCVPNVMSLSSLLSSYVKAQRAG